MDVDYTRMEQSALVEACGDDASKWADALAQYARQTGGAPTDVGWLIGWFANAIEQATLVRGQRQLSASEAVYGFAAYLTTRKEPVTLSASHNANVAVDLVKDFCATNELDQPRDGWHLKLKHPER